MSNEPAVSEFITCKECGKDDLKGPAGLGMHWRSWCPKNPDADKFRELKEEGAETARHEGPANVRSKRGLARRGFSTRTATSLEQVRKRPGGLVGGPASYFINSKGATISEALIVYPSGAPVINKTTGRDIANSSYRQQRMRDRGFEYVGPTLTLEGAKRLVEVIQGNRDDFVLDLREQITDCDNDIETSDNPQTRDNQRKRRTQLELLLRQAREPIDPDALYTDLSDIVAAHKLASLPAGLLEAMRAIAGDAVSANVEAVAAKLSGGKTLIDDSGLVVTATNAEPGADF